MGDRKSPKYLNTIKTQVMNNELIKNEESPQNLISLAIEKGASIEQLEKLLALKERWDAIQANKSFISAMSTFQKEVPTIEKRKLVNYPSKSGGMVNYKYAELGEIDETIKGPMAANGLSKRWQITEEGEKLICTCIISHIDGHTEHTSMSSLKDASGNKNEIQSRASAISYLQRYTLIGALGLTTASEDNDGSSAGDIKSEPVSHNVQQEDTREWLSEAKFKEGIEMIKAGEQGVYDSLNAEFKMKKTYREELKSTKAVWKAKEPDNTKQEEPFVIPGHWFAKMEKCKTKADVIKVYNDNKATIDASPELMKLLKDTRTSLSTPQLNGHAN